MLMIITALGSANLTNTCWARAKWPLFNLCIRSEIKFSTIPDKVLRNHRDEDCDDFLPWLEQKACMQISSVLYIGKSAFGRGLYASKHIEAGDCILRVPHSVQLAPDNLPPRIYSSLGKEVSNVAKVAILLLHHMRLGQKSEWGPYISRLPPASEMHNTNLWTNNELEMIRQSSVYPETMKQRNVIEKEFLAIKPVLDQFRENFSDFSLEDFAYACALVTSRAWESPRGVSMIPFADFLNHDGASEAFLWSKERKLFSEVIADRNYVPGDQVLVRYGKFSNHTLALDFGFTLPYNINDQVEVQLDIPHDDHLRQMKLQLLQRFPAPAIKDVNGFSPSEKCFTIKEVKSGCSKGRGIPQAFRAFARIVCCNYQELSDLAWEAAQNDGRLARNPLTNKNKEIEAHQLMLSRVNQLIEDYDASIKSLEQTFSRHMLRRHPLRRQMARDLFSGEIRVLMSASAWLKHYCATI
ncbi:OLC1v1026569C1 [Oldenlandia corymbosa var. corymbosa]|uniref:OLC1v1026569C1 n=1 Tax=Oldenlandia corymbosa var. corymbosa TaxID=529605 RepID=A0AAV1CAC0_OLDCO|nr:OLC1v1026569C1 [Oldenlandia corymbosa var. corymbosa]